MDRNELMDNNQDNGKMDFNKVHIIKASAGSGKTYNLTKRLFESVCGKKNEKGELVCVGKTEPDKCIATTFTCAAAAELLDRIYRKFLEEGKLEEADRFLDSMVGTVHSVCATLLTDYAIAAGLSPSLRVLPEKLTDTIFWHAVAEVITYDDNKAKLFERLSQSKWKEDLRKIVDIARSNKIETAEEFKKIAEWNIEEVKKFFPGTSNIDLKAIADGFAGVLPKTIPENISNGKLFDSIVEFVRLPSWRGLMGIVNGNFESSDREKIGKLANHLDKLSEDFLSATGSHEDLNAYCNEAKILVAMAEEIYQRIHTANIRTKKPDIQKLLEKFVSEPNWKHLVQFMRQDFGASQVAMELIKVEEFVKFHSSIHRHILDSSDLFNDVKEMIEFLFDRAAEVIREFQRYKDKFGLMDFNDQETRALELISKQSFKEDLSERASLLMVDEFQDTNPIQLALMNGIHQAIHQAPEDRDETVWVGDPKQSIYSFRGADTTLMIETAKSVEHQTTLDDSHRSKKELVELSNRVFTHVFSTHDKNTVRLGVKREDPDGGKISSWLLNPGNKGAKALAIGIAKLIEQDEFKQKGYKRSDIAVLCFTGNDCKVVAEALAGQNIPSTYASRKLRETIECQLVLAAYQYALDNRNLLAAARFRILSGEKTTADLIDALLEKHRTLPPKPRKPENTDDNVQEEYNRAIKTYTEERRKAFDSVLIEGSSLQRLKSITNRAIDLTPGELLERVIQMLDIDQIIDRLQFPEARRCNLDALRKAANDYLQLASVGGLSPSPAGFLTWIQQADLDAAAAAGDDLVHVMTYHKAKGLEWPIVILYSLDGSLDLGKRIFNNGRALSADRFRPEDPLSGRLIHYWPTPVGQSKNDELCARLMAAKNAAEGSLVKKLDELDTVDAKNRFYVGVTRARDQIILAMRTKTEKKGKKTIMRVNTTWIDDVAPGVFHWPTVEGETKEEDEEWLRKTGFTLEGEKWEPVAEDLTLETKIFSADDSIDTAVTPKPVFLDLSVQETDFYPAILNPSKEKKTRGTAEPVNDYKSQLPNLDANELEAITGKGSAATRFGDAFHQYVEYIDLHPQENNEATAKKYLKAHDCASDENAAAILVNQTKALYDWIKNENRWPDGQILCEVPITLTNSEGQRYQGSIDMLVETDKGYVIIDHKTHSDEEDDRTYAADQWAQLNIYRQAVEKATGKKVLGTYVHLPTLGKIYKIGPKNDASTPNANAQ